MISQLPKTAILIGLSLFLAACSAGPAAPAPVAAAGPDTAALAQAASATVPPATATTAPTRTPAPSLTPSRTPSPTATVTATPTQAPPTATANPLVESRAPGETLYLHASTEDADTYSAWTHDDQGRFRAGLALASVETLADPPSPADAADLAFAHNANWVAYWVESSPPRLWIADLALQHPRLVFEETAGASVHYVHGRLAWSVGDHYLFIEPATGVGPALLFSLAAGRTEPWPWKCDRVAPSPRTQQLAAWCVSTAKSAEFAVMEGDGTIWISPGAPAAPPAVKRAYLTTTQWSQKWIDSWAWAPAGDQIAFIDPLDSAAGYGLADASGRRLSLLPGQLPADEAGLLWARYLQWSDDGRRLLALADGSATRPCPGYHDPFSPDPNEVLAAPCWQMLDTASGEVLWSLSDSAASMMARLNAPAEAIQEFLADQASLSPDGAYLAVSLTLPGMETVFILDLNQGGQAVAALPGPVNAMRWARVTAGP